MFWPKKDDHGFEAVPAVVIADNTNKFGKRLGQFALALLLLFFAIAGYVQSARNGRQLEEAGHNRTNLIESLSDVTNTVNHQTVLIEDLQKAVRQQNQILKDAGLTPIVVPGDPIVPTPQPGASPTPRVMFTPSPNPQPEPQPKPTSKPTSKPSPSPTPSPGPVSSVVDQVCKRTGICL